MGGGGVDMDRGNSEKRIKVIWGGGVGMLKGYIKFKFWDFLRKGNWDVKIVLFYIK